MPPGFKRAKRVSASDASYSLQLKLVGDHDAAKAFAKNFAKNMPIAREVALEQSAKRAKEILRHAISRGEDMPSLSFGSLRKRKMGKLRGAENPPVDRYSRSIPLARSLNYARSVSVMKLVWANWATGIREGDGAFSGGKTLVPIAVYAMEQEFGFIRLIPLTLRMHAYLRILYQGYGRRGSRHLPKKSTGRALRIVVPPRPVWKNTFEKYYVSGKVDPDFFMTNFWRAMNLPGFKY